MVIAPRLPRLLALIMNVVVLASAAVLMAAPDWGAELRAQDYGPEVGGAFFGNQPVGATSPAMTVRVVNTSDAEATITTVRITGEAYGDFALISDGCSGQKLGGASEPGKVDGGTCDVTVQFTPSELGLRVASLIVSHLPAGRDSEGPLEGFGIDPTPAADIGVSVTDIADPVARGESVSYVVTVTNNGPSEARNVIVVDELPLLLSLVAATSLHGVCEPTEPHAVRCSFASIAAHSSVLIAIEAIADGVGTVTNRAERRGSEPADPNPLNDTAAEDTTLKRPLADLAIAKTAVTKPARVGQPLTYSITVTNLGPNTAYGALVHDHLPGSVTFASATPTQGSCTFDGASTVSCVLGKLSPGTAATIALVVEPTAVGPIVNRADVMHDYDDPISANNDTSVETNVEDAAVADLAITKTADPKAVRVGDDIIYTLTATNLGPANATAVTVVDTLPNGLIGIDAVASQGSCRLSLPTLTCDLGALTTGATATILIKGTVVDGDAPGLLTLSNRASIKGRERDPQPANDNAEVAVAIRGADLAVTMTDAPDPVVAGQNLTYAITVENKGPFAATGVTLADTLPAEVAFVSATPSQGACALQLGVVLCDLGGLAPAAKATITIVVVPNGGGKPVVAGVEITNTVVVFANEPDPNPADNTRAVATLVTGTDLSVTMVGGPAVAVLPSEVSYLVTMGNAGPSPATGLTLNVTLPVGATYRRVEKRKDVTCAYAAGTLTCSLRALDRGKEVAVAVFVSPRSAGLHSATATIAGNEPDPRPGNNTATTQVEVVQPKCLDGTAAAKDTDGDALWDCWELHGFDVNGDGVADLLLPGANVNRKDLYVEVDAMSSYVPSAATLARVAAAFARAPVVNVDGTRGIRLHFEGATNVDDKTVDEDDWPEPHSAFQAAKDKWFGTARQRGNANWPNIKAAKEATYRYAIFAKSHSNGTSSGLTLSPSNFMVTLGAWTDFDAEGGEPEAQAATFMHEFGHALGLEHGGADSINCKPNYLSIMSYSLQFMSIDPTRPLDYSRWALPALNENGGLSEPLGIQGPAGRHAIWGAPVVTPTGLEYWPVLDPADGPINWNFAGAADRTNVTANINRIEAKSGCQSTALLLLTSQNDWVSLHFDLATSPLFEEGDESSEEDAQRPAELTPEEVFATASRVDFDADGFSNAVDNCPARFNPDQQDSDRDGVGDVCEKRDLVIILDATPDPATVGDAVTYSIVVENAGTEPLTNVSASTELPAGLSFVSGATSQGECTWTDGVRCALRTLPPQATATITIVVRADDAAVYSLGATAASNEPDDTPGDNTAIQLLTVRLATQPPVADAGPDQKVQATEPAALVTLDGSRSFDPDGQPLAFEWRDEAGQIVGKQAIVSVRLAPGTHLFELTVTDPDGQRARDSVHVIVVEMKDPSGAPDLVVRMVTTETASVVLPGVLTVSDVVANLGSRESKPSITRYYLMAHGAQGAVPIRIAVPRLVPALGPNTQSARTTILQLSGPIAAGFYTLLACADDTTHVTESDETNNCLGTATPVKVQ